MAKWSGMVDSWTPVAVADTTNMTNAGFCALRGGSATQRISVLEVFLGGVHTASAPCIMQLARNSQVGATPTGGDMSALDPATAALAAPPIFYNSAVTTFPQRDAALKLLSLGFNAFGGIVKWTAPEGFEPVILGNTASLGEMSLSAFTGGAPGLLNSHILFEPL
jgi:hypothetical protein